MELKERIEIRTIPQSEYQKFENKYITQYWKKGVLTVLVEINGRITESKYFEDDKSSIEYTTDRKNYYKYNVKHSNVNLIVFAPFTKSIRYIVHFVKDEVRDYRNDIDPKYTGKAENLKFNLEIYYSIKGDDTKYYIHPMTEWTGVEQLNSAVHNIKQAGLMLINNFKDQEVSLHINVDCEFMKKHQYVNYGKSLYKNDFAEEQFNKYLEETYGDQDTKSDDSFELPDGNYDDEGNFHQTDYGIDDMYKYIE